jgi:hypothetical protein
MDRTTESKYDLYYDYFYNEEFGKMTDDEDEFQFLSELRFLMFKNCYSCKMLFKCDEYDDSKIRKLYKLGLSIFIFDEHDTKTNKQYISKFFNILDYFDNLSILMMKIDRYDEINDIKEHLTRYNYFYRVFKKHYKQKYIYRLSFPLELYNYITKIDKCIFNKTKNLILGGVGGEGEEEEESAGRWRNNIKI